MDTLEAVECLYSWLSEGLIKDIIQWLSEEVEENIPEIEIELDYWQAKGTLDSINFVTIYNHKAIFLGAYIGGKKYLNDCQNL